MTMLLDIKEIHLTERQSAESFKFYVRAREYNNRFNTNFDFIVKSGELVGDSDYGRELAVDEFNLIRVGSGGLHTQMKIDYERKLNHYMAILEVARGFAAFVEQYAQPKYFDAQEASI